jgi:hypothetical protein
MPRQREFLATLEVLTTHPLLRPKAVEVPRLADYRINVGRALIMSKKKFGSVKPTVSPRADLLGIRAPLG